MRGETWPSRANSPIFMTTPLRRPHTVSRSRPFREIPLQTYRAPPFPCRVNIVMNLQVLSAAPASMNELSRGRRIGILLICSMSLLIVGLDVTIVNIALPSIGRDFHAPVSGLQWTVDAYTLTLAG